MSTMLILGGVRSGKSRLAERLATQYNQVTYVAPGPVPDRDNPVDQEWADRVAAHQAARPAHWITVETADVAEVLSAGGAGANGHGRPHTRAVLVDCLGTWVTRLIDDAKAWDDRHLAIRTVQAAVDELERAIGEAHQAGIGVILVTNEVGLGVVPEHLSGRLFRDCLGRVNQMAARACEKVAFIMAGRVMDLSGHAGVEELATSWGAVRRAPRDA